MVDGPSSHPNSGEVREGSPITTLALRSAPLDSPQVFTAHHNLHQVVPSTHARLLHFPEMLAQWELQEAASNKSCFFHSDQRTFQRKPQSARRGLGRTSMLTVSAKGNILGFSKHSNWKQGAGISHVRRARAGLLQSIP